MDFNDVKNFKKNVKSSEKTKGIDTGNIMSKGMALMQSKNIKYLIGLLIYFLLSGIIATIYIILSNLIIFIFCLLITSVIISIIVLILKIKNNGSRRKK